VFLAALGFFELGSLVCAVAPSSSVLIFGRALAGLGKAGILSGAVILAAKVVPLSKRPVLVGFVSALNGVAAIAGPLLVSALGSVFSLFLSFLCGLGMRLEADMIFCFLRLGGVFTTHLSWRWCFYINLPLGVVAAFILGLFFKTPRRESQSRLSFEKQLQQLDLEGTALFIPSILCLLLALQWGGTQWDWNNGRIIALFILSGVLAIIYIGVQIWKRDAATLPPRLVKNRNIWSCALCIASIAGTFFIIIYYVGSSTRIVGAL
jgi:MFS family permease